MTENNKPMNTEQSNPDTEKEKKPFIHVEFEAANSTGFTITSDGPNASMVYLVSKMLERFADTLFAQEQAEMMQQRYKGLEIAQMVPPVSPFPNRANRRGRN